MDYHFRVIPVDKKTQNTYPHPLMLTSLFNLKPLLILVDFSRNTMAKVVNISIDNYYKNTHVNDGEKCTIFLGNLA